MLPQLTKQLELSKEKKKKFCASLVQSKTKNDVFRKKKILITNSASQIKPNSEINGLFLQKKKISALKNFV